MNSCSLSIIIPARNAASTLGILLDSIYSSDPLKHEVIVVDDASSDRTPDIAGGYEVQVIRLARQSGPAAARNAGAAAARGDILLFLDSDVRLHQGTLEHMVSRFTREPDLACLVGIYSKHPVNRGIFPHYKAIFNYFLFKDATRMESFETSCGAVRKRIFEEVGGFDESYEGAEVEDYEMGYRIGRKYEVVLDTRVQVDHHFPGFFKNARNFFTRGRLWFRLFLRRRRFDSAGGTTADQARGIVAALPVALALCAVPFFGYPACAALFVTGAVYLGFNGRFFIYCVREKGLPFGLTSIAFHFANSLVIMAGTAAAFLPPYRR